MHDHKPLTAKEAAYWKRLLAPYMKAKNGIATLQLVSTFLLFVGAWWLAYQALEVGWWLTLLIAVPTAGLQIRLFIFQHDCGHGAFFRSPRLNHLVGGFLGALTATPYRYWRRAHAIHHATSGDLDYRGIGDIATLTVDEYRALSRWGRLKYRMYRHPLVFTVGGAIWVFVLKHRLPLDMPKGWKKEWMSILWNDLAMVAVLVTAAFTIGLGPFLAVQLPITIIAGSLGIWLFYVQHQFEDTYWREHEAWEFHQASLEGSSLYDLPRVLHWFTGNIGFHHIHHLASRIPNYRLSRCFREVKELHHVTRLSLWESLHCARLKLWDPDADRLISFSDLRAAGGGRA